MKLTLLGKIGATYSPPSPFELQYADTTPSIHPARPIRPLPKRRLRSRVSSEVAESILYSADVNSTRSLFQIPYDEPRFINGAPKGLPNGNSKVTGSIGGTAKESYQFKGNDFDGDEEAMAIGHHQEQRQRSMSMNTMYSKLGYTRNDGSKFARLPIPHSTASHSDSIDGYDSFENTNNKKKRKIPMSGALGNHQSSLSTEMAQMGISSARDLDTSQVEADGGVGHYYGSGSSAVPTIASGNGISGAGRGRYGRAGTRHYSGRSPLGVSVNGSNTLQASRSLYHRRENPTVGSTGSKGEQTCSLVYLPGQHLTRS